MPVGKGSLKRAVSAKTAEKNEIFNFIQNNVVDVEIANIKFKKAKDVDEMVNSINTYGVILPVIACQDGGTLKVVDGAKRLTALAKMGVKTVKAVIVNSDGKNISSEIAKFDKKVVKDDIHEEKFNVIKRLGEDDLPVYLL